MSNWLLDMERIGCTKKQTMMAVLKDIWRFISYLFWPQIRQATPGQGRATHCKRQTDNTRNDNQPGING